MSESLNVSVEVLPELTVVRAVADRLDEERLQVLQNEICSTAESRSGVPIALDLSGVPFISSLSLAVLIRMASNFRDRGQRLMLTGLNPNVREIIIKTKLDQMFELHDDVDAARRAAAQA